jgi:hypothetical protein
VRGCARSGRSLLSLLASFAAIGLVPGSAAALPPEPPPWYEGIYVGGGLGAGHGADVSERQVRAPFDAAGVTIQQVDDGDDWELAWHAFLGYQVCRFFAFEGGYTSLGSFNSEFQVVEDPGGFRVELEPHAWTVGGLVTTPPWKGMSAFGKVGAAFWKADLDIDNRIGAGVLASGDDARGVSVVWGFGGRVFFTRHLGIRAEWERFENVGSNSATGRSDFDAVLASVVVSF